MEVYNWARELLEDVPGGNLKWLILATGVGYLAYRILWWGYVQIQLPPGPIGWPWLGYTRCLGSDAFKEVQLLHRKYGPVVSFRLCGKLVIVLNDEDSIKEAALRQRALIGRHTMLTNHLLAKGFGISNYDGENATFLRRIFIRGLHLVMPGRTCDRLGRSPPVSDDPLNASTDRADLLTEKKLAAECSKLVDFLHRQNGEPVEINSVFRHLVWNVVWVAGFGTDCPLDDNTITELIHCVAENNSVNGPFQFKQMLPNIWYYVLLHSRLARRMLGVDEIWNRYERVTSILSHAVQTVIANPNRSKGCLISQLLDGGGGNVSLQDVNRLAFELMAAGVDTTTLTLVWSCYAIASGKLEVSDGDAFGESHLEVVHRLASVVPMALPHYARFDSRIHGYYVPKGSAVFFNVFAVHQAQLQALAAKRGCPHAQNGISRPKTLLCESAIPFSLGPRACPGFMFATRVITRVMSHIVEQFRIEECSDASDTANCQTGGLTRPPVAQCYRFIARKDINLRAQQ
ncbi:unnamed protein product [Mesocestoides corti]|uniref:Cytochrome P450 n=1 Tax=Mesocestoides corti TaxID=53468 RepID=A0A0R3U9U6_MESCO|nr:unnamed protein product [Mesocestoides corti]